MLKPSIYIASLFSRREEMEGYANQLKKAGFDITARWVYGGEEGLDREAIAELDLDDVIDADMVLSFTSPYGTYTKGGGRHVEFGFGAGLGKGLAIIGERENVFHWLPEVVQFNSLEEFISDYE